MATKPLVSCSIACSLICCGIRHLLVVAELVVAGFAFARVVVSGVVLVSPELSFAGVAVDSSSELLDVDAES